MDKNNRRAAIRAYKERKPNQGVVAIRTPDNADIWVAPAPDLGAIWNRTKFMLQMGRHSNGGLQMAWNSAGPDALSFEILEKLDEDTPDVARARLLKERADFWREKLGAQKL